MGERIGGHEDRRNGSLSHRRCRSAVPEDTAPGPHSLSMARASDLTTWAPPERRSTGQAHPGLHGLDCPGGLAHTSEADYCPRPSQSLMGSKARSYTTPRMGTSRTGRTVAVPYGSWRAKPTEHQHTTPCRGRPSVSSSPAPQLQSRKTGQSMALLTSHRRPDSVSFPHHRSTS